MIQENRDTIEGISLRALFGYNFQKLFFVMKNKKNRFDSFFFFLNMDYPENIKFKEQIKNSENTKTMFSMFLKLC